MTATFVTIDLAELVAAHATDADRCGRLDDAVVDALHEQRLFRLFSQEHHGGLGLPLREGFTVIEDLAAMDGAVGWNVAIASMGLDMMTSRLSDGAADRILKDQRAIIAGSVSPDGVRASRVDGGYRFAGKAGFASGSAHASWFMVASLNDGHVVAGLVRRELVTILDSWHVSGLRATSSADIVVHDTVVADDFTFTLDLAPTNGQIDTLPLASRLGVALTFVALGIARHATDRLVAIATTRSSFASTAPLADRGDVQIATARARGLVDSGRAYVLATWDEANAKLASGQPLEVDDLARLRLSYVTATENAIAATDLAWACAGSSALFEGEPIERCWRDVHAVGQHAFVSTRHYERVGRISLGLSPGPGPV